MTLHLTNHPSKFLAATLCGGISRGWRLCVLLALTVGSYAFALGDIFAQSPASLPLRSMRGHEVTLHYVALGNGEPVVLVHGGLEHYRAWSAQLAPLATRYRVIAYSRRYNFPNRTAPRRLIRGK